VHLSPEWPNLRTLTEQSCSGCPSHEYLFHEVVLYEALHWKSADPSYLIPPSMLSLQLKKLHGLCDL